MVTRIDAAGGVLNEGGVIISGGEVSGAGSIDIGGEINGDPKFEGDGFGSEVSEAEQIAEQQRLEQEAKDANARRKQAIKDEQTAKAQLQEAKAQRGRVYHKFSEEKKKIREYQEEVKKLQADLEAAEADGNKKKSRSILNKIKTMNNRINKRTSTIKELVQQHHAASVKVAEATTLVSVAQNYVQETTKAYENALRNTGMKERKIKGKLNHSYTGAQTRSVEHSANKPVSAEQKLDRLVEHAEQNKGQVEEIAKTAEESATVQRGMNLTGNAAERAVQSADEVVETAGKAVVEAEKEVHVVGEVVEEVKPLTKAAAPLEYAAPKIEQAVNETAVNAERVFNESRGLPSDLENLINYKPPVAANSEAGVIEEGANIAKKAGGKMKWLALGAATIAGLVAGAVYLFSDKKTQPAPAPKQNTVLPTDTVTETKPTVAPADTTATAAAKATTPTQATAPAQANAPADTTATAAAKATTPTQEATPTQETDSITPAQPATVPTSEEVEEDNAPTTEELEAEVAELEQNNIYTVKKGDCVWNIAKDLLEDPNQDGVKENTDVSDPEIAKKVRELVGANENLKFEEDGKHIMIHAGDKIKY